MFRTRSAAIASANGLKGAIYGVIIVLFVLFEPLGLYGRWLKIKLFFQLFPLYKRATFKRQKIYVKSERNQMSYFRAENLSLHFGGLKAVDAVSFAVEKGEILSIIGPNGAGKSSIFNLISRIYPPTSGRIFFEDQDITQEPAYDIAGLGIARTFQNIELFENATMLSNLLVGRHRHSTTQLWQELLFLPSVRANEKAHRRRVEQVIEFLDLEAYRDKLISGLPYGVRKVIELARALCSEPKLILLDEPSSGLNVEETDDMSFWIRDMKTELGITVLMVEHDMTLVNRVSDRVIALNYGRVLAMGSPAEVQRHPDVVAAYLGA